jgi:hypothetical protein
MVDCDLCTRAVVTANPVKVPSKTLAYREGGKWRGLCDGCFEVCGTKSIPELIEGVSCDLCGERKTPLYNVEIGVPYISGEKKDKRAICKECLDACQSAYKNRGAPQPHH